MHTAVKGGWSDTLDIGKQTEIQRLSVTGFDAPALKQQIGKK